ncbi:MAG: hypothetical protein H6537_10545 [Bacteroidales bacterium]|nr:hypothetical protein [Bacteroidales bacterium]
MKKIIIILATTIIPLLSFSQSLLLKSRIIDKNSKLGIPFSNIWVLSKDIGTNSLENGDFVLLVDSTILMNEKLKITAIGYYDTIIDIKNIKFPIYLHPRVYKIQEVTVFPNKKNSFVVNPINKKTHLGYMLSSNVPIIMCRYFPYSEQYLKNEFISKIIVYTRKSLRKHKFNIHIYEYDTTTNKPGRELVNKATTVSTKAELGFGISKNVLDLSKNRITYPKTGLVVGVEWIMNYENFFEEEVNEKNGGINAKFFEKRFGPDFAITYENSPIRWTYDKGFWINDDWIKWAYSKKGFQVKGTSLIALTPAISIILTD